MAKKTFRPCASQKKQARYPTSEDFDAHRRSFLARLGAAVLAAGPVASLLAGCGDRPVGPGETPPDTLGPLGGTADQMPAPLDAGPPDVSSGTPDVPPARLDGSPPGADLPPLNDSAGVPDQPSAKADQGYADGWPMAGAPNPPDAASDK